MVERARHLVVGRLRKTHGLKGECAIFPLTDDPDAVFAVGRPVWVLNLSGEEVAGPLVVERCRSYHREWLITFVGHTSREAVTPWRGMFLGAPTESLAPPKDDEVYIHELSGFALVAPDGTPLGLVTDVLDFPAGLTLEVQGPKREFLVPFRKEFVRELDRDARRLVVSLPDGLMDI